MTRKESDRLRAEAVHLERRIKALRAVEYPTEAEMRELETARSRAAEINDSLGKG